MNPDLAELQRRHQTALSLIGHRLPTERLVELLRLALLGATLEDLMQMERMH